MIYHIYIPATLFPSTMYAPGLKFASLLLAAAVLAGACSKREEITTAEPAAAGAAQQSRPADAVYREVEWADLIPEDDLDALLNPPDYLENIPEGSAEDEIAGKLSGTENRAAEDRYQQALASTRIKPEFDRQRVRIPGFVVPLEFDEEQTITSFFLVPYFGACLHLPPPPPNQIIHASFPKGMQVEFLYDPFYVEGELRTLRKESELGTAAYSMTVERIYVYED
ncbi:MULTISPECIES: DUF3299 domain-containing protein [unclassified Microbulbifer]|uniref:DUF3299 domain-containing protein n=1 Tax=unclassified Microbulbifer TaxID=2619833 RepID=UPI0027E57B3D|nr:MULTISPECIES: DUF3299 domain-containing protein [unclassified Microbulbifer]